MNFLLFYKNLVLEIIDTFLQLWSKRKEVDTRLNKIVQPSEEGLTNLLGTSEKQPPNLMGYCQARAAKSVMISDREKLLMLRVCAWLSANKSLAPCGVVIEVER